MLNLQGIFNRHYADYLSKHKLPKYLLRAADAIMKCRTPAMGYHVTRCAEGHVIDTFYNSCKHRACPQCAWIQIERWLEKQKSRLIRCAHHHIIFTLPHELNRLWDYNSTLMSDLFFSAVRDTLFVMLENPRHLGATPGLLANLQTWGRDVSRHPHIHCLVTAGGLNRAGEWVHPRHPNYFLPGRAVAALFRGKLLGGLQRALAGGNLRLPNGTSKRDVQDLIDKLFQAEWNVNISARYPYGLGVVQYLAKYVKGGPLSNGRLISDCEAGVTYEYKDHHDGKTKQMCVSHEEFIRRILSHVPEVRLRTFRSYGLYYRRNKELLNRSRKVFSQPPVQEPPFLTFDQFLHRKGEGKSLLCPICGGRVASIERHYKARVRTVLLPGCKAA
jgi:hypothetical protein